MYKKALDKSQEPANQIIEDYIHLSHMYTCTSISPLTQQQYLHEDIALYSRFIKHSPTKPLNIVNRGVTLSLKAMLSLHLLWLLAKEHVADHKRLG